MLYSKSVPKIRKQHLLDHSNVREPIKKNVREKKKKTNNNIPMLKRKWGTCVIIKIFIDHPPTKCTTWDTNKNYQSLAWDMSFFFLFLQ